MPSILLYGTIKPDCVSPIFVKFSLFLIYAHSETLIHLASMLQNFKILEHPFEEESPIVAYPISGGILSFLTPGPTRGGGQGGQ